MIISKTPFRVSFFGGGTDYPVWLKHHKGAVLATTIDKYCYIFTRRLPPFFEFRSRILYSFIELVKENKHIKHPSVRECLKFMSIKDGIEIHHDGDLPARTGLGSSSSFTVGLLNTLYALKGRIISQDELARVAIKVEQELLKENVGSQDQICAAIGGFNLIEFNNNKDFHVTPITVNPKRLKEFQSHLMLMYTGLSRTASEIAATLVKTSHRKTKELQTIYDFVFDGIKILGGNGPITEFGKLLHESWKLKRSLTDKITTPEIDAIYSAAMKSGAIGGKLLGAGGGGFMLIFAEPGAQPKIKKKLSKYLHVPFRFDNSGSRLIYYRGER